MNDMLIDDLKKLEEDLDNSCCDLIIERPKKSRFGRLWMPIVVAAGMIAPNLNAYIEESQDSRLLLNPDVVSEQYEPPTDNSSEIIYPINTITPKKSERKISTGEKIMDMLKYEAFKTGGIALFYGLSETKNDAISWSGRDMYNSWKDDGLLGAVKNFGSPWRIQWRGSPERPGYIDGMEDMKSFVYHPLEGYIRAMDLLNKGYDRDEVIFWHFLGNYFSQSFVQSGEHPSLKKDILPYVVSSIIAVYAHDLGMDWRKKGSWKRFMSYLLAPPIEIPF